MMKSTGTLLDIFHKARNGRTAIVVPELGLRVSYESLEQQTWQMANALAGAGVQRNVRVAIALPNGLPAIVCFLAASIAGTAAPLKPAYRHDEFNFFLEDTDARVLICPVKGADEARQAAAAHNIPVFSTEIDSNGCVELRGAHGKGAATA